jgi:Fe2+ transport system protein FeoA
MNEITTLSELPIGRKAVVRAVEGEGTVHRRLMEMGVVPGTLVRVIKSAPFGDPIEVRVMGYNLALRKSEAAAVSVAAVDAGK